MLDFEIVLSFNITISGSCCSISPSQWCKFKAQIYNFLGQMWNKPKLFHSLSFQS